MQVHAHTRELDRTGFNETSVAKIAMNPMAIQILSSNIYTNKPLAIVRELSANAYDAHVAAGTTDRPFDIWIPTQLNPEFRIRDYGTGLSHEDVTDLYVTYFGSTKRNSDDFIGAFGLGSKTPLAYSDRFFISSTYKGIRRDYLVYLNEAGLPVVSFIQEGASDDHDGLDIRLTVRTSDIASFQDAARRVLARFPADCYCAHGVVVTPIDYAFRTEHFALRRTNDGLTTDSMLVMGNMAYHIDWYSLGGYSDLTPLRKHIDFFMPIGAVSVQASREALSYDNRTLEVLRAFLYQQRKPFEIALQDYLDTSGDTPLARYLNTLDLALPYEKRSYLIGEASITRADDLSFARLVTSRKGKREFKTGSAFIPNERFKRYTFIWEPANSRKHLRTLETNPHLYDDHEACTIFIRGDSAHRPLVEQIIGTDIQSIDDLPLAPVVRSTPTACNQRRIGLQIFDRGSSQWIPYTAVFDDLPRNTVFVKLEQGDCQLPVEREILRACREPIPQQLLAGVQIIGIPRASRRYDAQFEARFPSLATHWRLACEAYAQHPAIQRRLRRIRYIAHINKTLERFNSRWAPETDDHPALARRIRRLMAVFQAVKRDVNRLNILRDIKPADDTCPRGLHRAVINAEWLVSRYPLIFCTTYGPYLDINPHLSHYITLINQTEN